MNKFFREDIKKIPVNYQADVAVAGGGIAGIAAALAAARMGASVLLIEKQCIVGGLATTGLIAGYLPLCDGEGCQISYGIAEELLHLSIRYGTQSELPESWLKESGLKERKKRRYEVQFNPQYFALLAEQQLISEGVRVLYDTRICSVLHSNDNISALIVENKSGRIAIEAKSYVDATGDAEIYRFAGAPTRTFGKGNILAGWYYFFDGKKICLRPLGFAEVFDEDKKDTVKPLIDRRFHGTDGEDITDILLHSHEETLKDILKQRELFPRMEPTALPTMPQLRMVRCIRGEYELKETENGRDFEDSIGMIADWRKRGMIYEVPYRCLYCHKLYNVISAGRCIGTDDGMWDISRVIPPCAVTGQAAGTAAALTGDFSKLSYEELASALRKQGQRLKFAELDETEGE